MTNAFNRSIVRIAKPYMPPFGQIFGNRKAVILARDDAMVAGNAFPPLASVFDAWLVGAPVPVFELIRVTSDCECKELIPKTNTEGGDIVLKRPLYLSDGFSTQFRVPGTVTDEHRIVMKCGG